MQEAGRKVEALRAALMMYGAHQEKCPARRTAYAPALPALLLAWGSWRKSFIADRQLHRFARRSEPATFLSAVGVVAVVKRHRAHQLIDVIVIFLVEVVDRTDMPMRQREQMALVMSHRSSDLARHR